MQEKIKQLIQQYGAEAIEEMLQRIAEINTESHPDYHNQFTIGINNTLTFLPYTNFLINQYYGIFVFEGTLIKQSNLKNLLLTQEDNTNSHIKFSNLKKAKTEYEELRLDIENTMDGCDVPRSVVLYQFNNDDLTIVETLTFNPEDYFN